LPLASDATGLEAFVRAEDVRLDTEGPLEARVETVTFLGTHYRVSLSGITSGTLYALHTGFSVPKPGNTVKVAIAPEAVLTLPAEQKAA
jgi:putative spermidine/putrescine transport system ATP-binding protein